MNESLSISSVMIASVLSGLLIAATRFLPFVIFSKRKVPSIILFIEKYIPALIMAVLCIYCFKDVNFTTSPFGLPYIISVIVVVILHLTVKNSMVSIFGGTILFIILSRLM